MSESKILHSFVQQLKKFRKLYYAPDKWIDLSEYILILCDKDNSGNITCTELQHLTIALGMRLTDSEQNSLFEVFNSTKNISIFGYKIFKEETISLNELQHCIKNDISEEQFKYIAMHFNKISSKCSCNAEYKNIIYDKLHPELNGEYDVNSCKISLSDILSHTAIRLQNANANEKTRFTELFDDEWSEQRITLEYKLKLKNYEHVKLQQTIHHLDNERKIQLEKRLIETQMVDLLNKQIFVMEQQHVDELDALHTEMAATDEILAMQLNAEKDALKKERGVSLCISNVLMDRNAELESVINRHLEEIRTMKQIIDHLENENKTQTEKCLIEIKNVDLLNKQIFVMKQQHVDELDALHNEWDVADETLAMQTFSDKKKARKELGVSLCNLTDMYLEEIRTMKQTIDRLKNENNMQIEKNLIETQEVDLVNKEVLSNLIVAMKTLLAIEQQHVDELDALYKEWAVSDETLAMQSFLEKKTARKKLGVSLCNLTDMYLDEIRTMKQTIYDREMTIQELTNDNRCTNELLVNARQKLDRIYGENDNSYDAMKQKLDEIYEEIDNSHGAIKQIFRCTPAKIL